MNLFELILKDLFKINFFYEPSLKDTSILTPILAEVPKWIKAKTQITINFIMEYFSN
jgi:hypothetical protein